MSLVSTAGFEVGGKFGTAALGKTKTMAAAAASSKLGTSVTKSMASMNSKVLRRLRYQGLPGAFDLFLVGQKFSNSHPDLSEFVKDFSVETTQITSETVGRNMLLEPASRKGEYADGKLFVVSGGPVALDGGTMLQPLNLELHGEGLKMAMEKCVYTFLHLFITFVDILCLLYHDFFFLTCKANGIEIA